MDEVTLTTLSVPPVDVEEFLDENVSVPAIAIMETKFPTPIVGDTPSTMTSSESQRSEPTKATAQSQGGTSKRKTNTTTKKASGFSSATNTSCPVNGEAQIGVIFSQLLGMNRKLDALHTTLQQQMGLLYKTGADLNTIMEYYRDEQDKDDSFIEEEPSTEEETSEEETDEEEHRVRHRKRREKTQRSLEKKRRRHSESSENGETASQHDRKIVVSSDSERSLSENEISARESEDEQDQGKTIAQKRKQRQAASVPKTYRLEDDSSSSDED